MDFIAFSAALGRELGFLREPQKIDIDLGDKNDFELTLSESAYLDACEKYAYGNYIYSPGTEWGGIIGDFKGNTSSGTIKIFGDTWRGMMAKKIIVPPPGKAYLTVTGDLADVLDQIIGNRFPGLISADKTPTGVTVSYTCDRYSDMLSTVEKCLKTYDYRMDVQWSDAQGGVTVRAVRITDYSADGVRFGRDMRVDYSTRDYRRGINHLICLGSGELENRLVKHLYLQEDGSIGENQFYTGQYEREAVYDYPSAESEDELVSGGIQRLSELMDYKEMTIDNVTGYDIAIGDVVAGKDTITGMELRKPVTCKILRIQNGKTNVEYKVGD